MSDDIDIKSASYLPASGFTHTHNDIHVWAGKVVNEAKKIFGDKKIIAGLWAYREQGKQHLSCDLSLEDDSSIYLTVIICAEGEHYFSDNIQNGAEADTYDMAEAIHLAGIITESLDAIVKVGRQCNEINESLLERKLHENKTNGRLALPC